MAKIQCNACVYRDDNRSTNAGKNTFCMLHEKQVDNLAPGCEDFRNGRYMPMGERIEHLKIKKNESIVLTSENLAQKRHNETIKQMKEAINTNERIAKSGAKLSRIAIYISLGSLFIAYLIYLLTK